MLEIQIQLLTAWWQVADIMGQRLRDSRDDGRGEITATTALIDDPGGGRHRRRRVIASKIAANANNAPC